MEFLQLPEQWGDNFLALLAKVDIPSRPGELRPICVSSALQKLVNKIVCARTMPAMRRGSTISGCGKGRQAADVLGTLCRVRDVTQEWKMPALVCKLDISGAFDRLDRLQVIKLLKQRLLDQGLDFELKYLLAQLRTYKLKGSVPGGGEIVVEPNVGIKQGAPESAEIFGLVMDSLLTELINMRGWKSMGGCLGDLNIDLVFYQDDIFLIEEDLVKLGRRVKVLERHLKTAGLRLATEKNKIVASAAYDGVRKIKIGGDMLKIADAHESLKVLGLDFSLQESPSQQARELLSRTRAAAGKHGELLRGRAAWARKMSMISTLVESQFKWTAGALHWSQEDLRLANTIQLQTMRSAFRIRRVPGESWVAWNSRSMRECRLWLCNQQKARWSTLILTLQHTLHGHWARRVETIGNEMLLQPCLPMKALLWRNTGWWRRQQSLSPTTSLRHKGHVHLSNTERQLAEAHGNSWHHLACDRRKWTDARCSYLERWDARWCRGRQPAIAC